MLFRSATIQRDGIDRENRSLPLVLATETPVPTYARGRGVVNEVLRVGGMVTPAQVPMVDSHQRESVQHVLGSIRELSIEGGELVGRAYFASDPMSQEVFEKYADGHLQDFSVGAKREEVDYREDGTQVVTRSTLVEGSAVIAGADPNSKAMYALRAYTDPYELRNEIMFEELKAKLVERGLPEDATDEDVISWVVERAATAPKDDQAELKDILRALQDALPGPPPSPEVDDVAIERKRVEDLHELARENGADDETRNGWVSRGLSVAEATNELARAALKRLNETGLPIGPGTRVEGGESEREKFYNAAHDGVIARAIGKEVENAAPGSDKFRYSSVTDVAKEFLARGGEQIGHLPNHEIIRKALGQRGFIERADGPAYHTTGSFTNIFLDAINKTLRDAYDEAPSTYQRWVRQASSASDYKTLYRIVLGEFNLPDEVPENDPYPELTTSDAKESYRVAKHGGIFSISLESLVNDDMDAMVRVPRMQGAAMRRKINRDCYSILIDNPNMADGVALFHASSHNGNLDSTALAAGAPLDTGWNVMATQSGTDSTTVLGITPSYLIVPAALSATALQITSDMFVPTAQSSIGLYGSSGPRSLEVIVDGQIDNLGTATNWWLAASSSVVDTVEITFLQGEESPTLERMDGFETDTVKYKIRQSYGIKAIDYRGLYQGNS